ncbi:RICIN domain-containing protein [Streptomyces hygroscopicus]|uniref:RICIN domain-containing protein n=1 Tax=Streptomyces hygroscopicus TaxID=1912 RepID=UPI00223F5A8B|nr:hypothetical protein [Streptomyces hygroscopicus]
MKQKLRTAVAAGVMTVGSLAGTLALSGTAHAETYQRNVQLQDLQDQGVDCLDSNYNGSLYILPCNGGSFQRWNVTSYAPDVNNYYSRVQIQNVRTGRCLRVQFFAGNGYEAKTDSCDASNYRDQWNMTWVGNTPGNPSNSFQFLNWQPSGPLSGRSEFDFCLDRGQAGHANNMVFDIGQFRKTCDNHSNKWQIWSMVH